ncbi:putative circularly permuted ATP-grasp superfamily protein/putative alpha-E superfamily protein [Wenyingzhuangia heitensis]|uniref:Circularly permuted ATP-grasp superfamily protein/putative alpha-E superfamily protein n=1 Tax=Wenyingzhuangia heitensis TaxID=1487859 RepID=A0ABX0UA24_9FLAO|nr:circularly permuted type 2 ATP-grasp protein [Wenyingzhuangia heitensis]NIJ45593.1 putative circularly permuted ATP-grasp superfamily protein/putative alpha-E superfamily protein [Wenyingzhuangia heitensis]
MSIDSNKLFKDYVADLKNYDEILKPTKEINKNWTQLFDNIEAIGSDELHELQSEIDWLMAENGVTYNVYNDPNGLHRPWQLNAIPFIIHENEWSEIEKGIQQRAKLLDLILKDVYGERKLIKDGIIPPEVFYEHRGFLRQCDQIEYTTPKNLMIYSAELSRGPDGRMWVVNDRTQAPSGMGYALENRFTTSRITSELFQNIHVKQPSSFFNDFSKMLMDAAPEGVENPNIVILTPGPHNETYFEHAYLSSLLGYPLVKGNDLIVRNGFVWMKSLKGLKKVDVILRRVDDSFVDPLELREDSYLGVAGLLEIVRNKNITVINPIGSGIIENSGLVPFMNAICNYFFDEDLVLPQIASWWCGQEKERTFVLKNIKKFVVKRIDRSNRESLYFCEFLSEKEIDTLKEEIIKNPFRFVAQEKISFSSAPNYVNGKLEPRKVVCRTFSIAKDGCYTVMPGGLVRVASERKQLRVSNQRGGISKDFWIVSDQKQENIQQYTWSKSKNSGASDMNDLPSNTAENLFWSGRYLGRALTTSRFIRTVLNNMNNERYNTRKSESEILVYLFKAVTNITSTFPGFVGKGSEKTLENPLKELQSLILDKNRGGSLAQTLNSFNNSYYTLRNLWSKDMWRVFDSIKKLWKDYDQTKEYSLNSLIKLLDRTITRLIAFMGLIEESIMVNQGLLLYFIGLQMEQATMNIAKSRSLIVFNYEDYLNYEILEAFLNSHESLNIYRYSYQSYLSVENVVNLIILDKTYAKSLHYQLNRIQKDIARLPIPENSIGLNECQNKIAEACYIMDSINSETILTTNKDNSLRENLEKTLSDLSDLLHETSLAISNTYFDHTYQQTQMVQQKIEN